MELRLVGPAVDDAEYDDVDEHDEYGRGPYSRAWPPPCPRCGRGGEAPWPAQDLDALAARVGGRRVLEALDDAPLPDEPFAWGAIPVEVCDVVSAVVACCDRVCDALYDVERRTACRRVIARAARGGPRWFARSTPERLAASVVWVVVTDNGGFGGRSGGARAKDVGDLLGIGKTIRGPATTLIKAAGGRRDQYWWRWELRSPDLLVSRRRAEIIEERDGLLRDLARELDPWRDTDRATWDQAF